MSAELRAEVARLLVENQRLAAELSEVTAKADELFRFMGADKTAGEGSGVVRRIDACGYKYDADWSNSVDAQKASDERIRKLQARLVNAEGERDAALGKPRNRGAHR
jgi:hypothetical protein